MRRGTLTVLFFIILLALGAAFVVFWPNSGWHGVKNPFTITQGLDLQGGTSILLQPASGTPTDDQMNTTASLIESRINGGLGVKEPVVRVEHGNGKPSIQIDLPKFSGNEATALKTLLTQGKLEFWNTGPSGYLANNATLDPTQYQSYNNNSTTPEFTGNDLNPDGLSVGTDSSTGAYVIEFELKSSAAQRFGTFTSANISDYLTITLDRKVITSAVIQSEITSQGQITGKFTEAQAQSIVNVLKYGALPIALKEVSEKTIGGTLGAAAISKSALAGGLGLGIVILFMLLYYRVPGFLADIALILYATLTFAVFKVIGVTLTLAGITGFILSIGMAVDANVLIFERVKEELRAGRLLSSAIDIGWKRAWPSIRDSNCSTMITCAVLYTFGQDFGASTISGFATTLFLGVVISLFTAVVVTRTFLNLLVPTGFINHPALFGLPADAIPSTAQVRRNSAV